MRTRLATVLTLAALFPAPGAARSAGALRDEVAAIVERHVGKDGPGAAVAVVHRGRTVVVHAAGYADLDHRVPLDARSRFYLGSLSKQFTAACVGVLAAEGKLSLSHPVGRHVSGLPAGVAEISLERLLHHRSGIRDYLKIMDVNGDRDRPFDDTDALAIIGRQRGLVFPPGTRYQYSNSNYVLLAQVVQAASGKPLAVFARERVFEPAGLSATSFETDASAVIPGRVTSYRRDREGGWHRLPKLFEAVGDGGAWASLGDLVRWDRVLRDRSVFPGAVLDVLLTPSADAGTPYAGGLLVRPVLGQPALEHGGFMLGFQHHYVRFPTLDLALILLTNGKHVDSFALRDDLARAAAKALAGKALAAPAAETRQVEAPQAAATGPGAFPPPPPAVAGTYRNDELPLQLGVIVEEGRLFVHPATFRKLPLGQVDATRFVGMGGELQVVLGPEADRLSLTLRDLGEFTFTR